MTGRVLIDLTEFLHTSRTQASLSGVPRTLVEVSSRLIADTDLQVELFFYNQEAQEFYFADPGLLTASSADALIRRSSAGALARARAACARVVSPGPGYRALRRAIAALRHRDPVRFRPDDVVLLLGASWAPATVLPALLRQKSRVGFSLVTLIYDVISVSHPQMHVPAFVELYSDYLRGVLPMSRSVMAISRSAAAGVEAFAATEGLVIAEPHVISLGDSTKVFEDVTRPSGFPDGDYVLYVSTVEPRKNQTVLYQAFKQARLEGHELPRIVLVGRPGWLIDDFRYILENDPEVGDRIIWLTSVTDSELGWLYEHALFTVFPSIVEGWGLPIAESLAHGTFCITCDTSSMPEVGGELVDYLSPWDAAGWAREIRRYAEDPRLLAERADRIRREYEPKSWDDTAAAVKAALLGAAAER